jgi:hypothetical protein
MLFLPRFFLGVFCALLAIEAALRLLPVSTATETDYYLTPNIITYPPHHKFIMATGWSLANSQHHEANNYGFLSSRDFTYDENAVALIGDSYVEANMLAENERIGKQLENRLRRPVYALGGPGSSLLDYAERAQFAQTHFGIRDFVFVIEQGDVRQALCGSGNIHGPCLDPIRFNPRIEAQPKAVDSVKKVLRQSALAQYLFSQLELTPENVLKKLFFNAPPPATSNGLPSASPPLKDPEKVRPEAVDHVVAAFLARLRQLKDAHFTFVLDSDRDCLDAAHTSPTPVHDQFIKLIKQAKMDIIDTKPLFCDYFHSSGLSLSVSPSDEHWNRTAHNLAADAVASKLITP